jgi:hypothetical protein
MYPTVDEAGNNTKNRAHNLSTRALSEELSHILKFMFTKYSAERMQTYVTAPCKHIIRVIIIKIIIRNY